MSPQVRRKNKQLVRDHKKMGGARQIQIYVKKSHMGQSQCEENTVPRRVEIHLAMHEAGMMLVDDELG